MFFQLEIVHEDYAPHEFDIDIGIESTEVHNVTLRDISCDTEDSQQMSMRGKGNIRLSLLGLDEDSSKVISRLANSTCPPSDSGLITLLKRAKLYLFPKYDQISHLPLLRASNSDAIILFSTGTPHSVVFNKGDKTPKLFNMTSFDESIERFVSVLLFVFWILSNVIFNCRCSILEPLQFPASRV